MNELILNLQLMTPLFLKADNPSNNGAPVLRASPIRGELRYWLRALKASPEITGLKESERNRFGNTQTGSEISLYVQNITPMQIENRVMLPHRENGGGNPLESLCFPEVTQNGEAQRFILGIRGRTGLEISQDALLALLLWINLGGFGKRCRRGFGNLKCTSYKVMDDTNTLLPEQILPLLECKLPKNGEEIAERIKKIVGLIPQISISHSSGLPTYPFHFAPYPSFTAQCWAIIVGHDSFPSYKDAMNNFWRQHLRQPNYRANENAFGTANIRHASPVHMHIAQSQQGFHIVLTTFFAEDQYKPHEPVLHEFLDDCCRAYHGTAIYSC